MADKILVQVTGVIKFGSKVKKVYDNRLSLQKKAFVRVMLTNGTYLDIPTDCGSQMLALADAVSAVRKAEDLNKAVLDVISDFICENGKIAVQTGLKENTFRLLANDENVGKTGQSGIVRNVVQVAWVTL